MKSQKQLEAFRHVGDPLADAVISEIYEKGKPELREKLNTASGNGDLQSLMGSSGALSKLIENVSFPAWVNSKLLSRGQRLFRTYSVEMSAILGIYSLPYCYAAANGAKVLIHSRNILEKPQQRLSETAQFVVDIMADDGFSPTGRGYLSILKVRLLHATARYFAARHIRFEVPVNQEDMAGTNLAFSLICMRGLSDIGVNLDLKAREAYIHAWNVIGSMLGIDRELLPDDIKKAVALERAIRKHQFRYSEEGEKLTKSLTRYLQGQLPASFPFKSSDIVAYFLGQEVSKCVGLEKSPGFTSAAISSLRVRNLLNDFSKETFSTTSQLVKEQVERSDGTYFAV